MQLSLSLLALQILDAFLQPDFFIKLRGAEGREEQTEKVMLQLTTSLPIKCPLDTTQTHMAGWSGKMFH